MDDLKASIPDFQSMMLALLEIMSDGNVHTLAQLRDEVAAKFDLTPSQREVLLPSGTQPVFDNRVAWASVHLERAGLLERVKRGHYQMAPRGREVLEDPPERIDIAFLNQYPEFREFRSKTPKDNESSGDDDSETPEEILESAYQQLRDDLAAELLQQVKRSSPEFFERLVIELLVKMGYGGSRKDAGTAVGRSGDEGIDGIIKEDRLGLDVIYLQAKRWQGTVGRPEIQKFVGALHGQRARKGVFITTGAFSAEAAIYARSIDPKVVLIDGDELSELMIDFGIGVSSHLSYEVKRLDTDYFAGE